MIDDYRTTMRRAMGEVIFVIATAATFWFGLGCLFGWLIHGIVQVCR